ncbi:DUF4329 domain-containing protein [Maritalea mediterranea]|uniref:DUF4329 domain-containing protein n=1 Tax=Maritalea mediterranea TaxID=2909667 RepID=A0ABS9E9K9_9HYPH|nr:DUF4329 domain-containing protein [Maritalea mediterranea]MCF4098889.1 DUF4329 domain-containing protein [Maritalea mediterranea]
MYCNIKKLLLVLSTLAFSTSPALAKNLSASYLAKFFGPIQERSIAENREYCGYFGLDAAGKLIATKPKRGRADSCSANPSDNMVVVFASYHTHGAFHIDADSETPSSDDLEADIYEEVDGYVATPGGRIWKNDWDRGRAFLLCGRNCTISDPDYDNQAFPTVNNSYTLDGLYDRDDMSY